MNDPVQIADNPRDRTEYFLFSWFSKNLMQIMTFITPSIYEIIHLKVFLKKINGSEILINCNFFKTSLQNVRSI